METVSFKTRHPEILESYELLRFCHENHESIYLAGISALKKKHKNLIEMVNHMLRKRLSKHVKSGNIEMKMDTRNNTRDKHNTKTKRASRIRAEGNYEPRFEEFWKMYPRRTGKGAAYLAWRKLKVSSELLAQIKIALTWQIKSLQWTQDGGQFIPYPSTWLNQHRWLDEPQKPPAAIINDLTIERTKEIIRSQKEDAASPEEAAEILKTLQIPTTHLEEKQEVLP